MAQKSKKEFGNPKKAKIIEKVESNVDTLNQLDLDDSFFDIQALPFQDGGVTNELSYDYFTKEKIKRAYVSIRINSEIERVGDSLSGMYQVASYDESVFQSLSEHVLKGVRGVSSSKFNIADWLTHRDCLIVMPFDEFVAMNYTEQINYEDIGYLTKNGLCVMFRIYDRKSKEDKDYQHVLGNLFPKIAAEFEIESKTAKDDLLTAYAICAEIFNIHRSGRFIDFFGNQERVNSAEDFAKLVFEYCKSEAYQKEYYWNKIFPETIEISDIEPIIRRGIINAIRIYRDESEWILKDETLVVPPQSRLLFVLGSRSNAKEKYEEYIKKHNLLDSYKINFIKYKDVEKFRAHKRKYVEKRYQDELKSAKTETEKKIGNALLSITNKLFDTLKYNISSELTTQYEPPIYDYEDTHIEYHDMLSIPKIIQLELALDTIFFETLSFYENKIITHKDKYYLVDFYREFQNKIEAEGDKIDLSEEVGFDKYGNKLRIETYYNIYKWCVRNTIDIYEIAGKIKELVGSDLYRYFKKEEINFAKGGLTEKVDMKADGDCYTVAAKILIDNDIIKKFNFLGTPYLVHAEVTGQGKIKGIKYGHAWVEDDYFVYDYSNNREIILPKEFYYQLGQIKIKNGKYAKYTKNEAYENMSKYGHYGSWELNTEYETGGITLTGGLSENMSDEDIAKKYNITIEELERIIYVGMQVEKEHTDNPEAQRKIAKDHLVEDIDYYKKLKHVEDIGGEQKRVYLPDTESSYEHLKKVLNMQGINIKRMNESEKELDSFQDKQKLDSDADYNYLNEIDYYDDIDLPVEQYQDKTELVIQKYLSEQKEEAKDVISCSYTRIAKTMICKSKIELAERKMIESKSGEEYNAWNEAKNIWESALSELMHNPKQNYEQGGQPCGCTKRYEKGGLAYGNSHANGGIPLTVASTGQKIEIEGGEGVVNKKSMQMNTKLSFEGKKMTPCQIISKINQMGGGVKFKCEDVKTILDEDGSF